MERPPRRRDEPIIDRSLLVRAWACLGLVSAVLVMSGFLYVLLRAGWHPGDDVGTGSPLHHAYIQATTMSFLGIVSCQLGTAFAARTDRGSLRSIGFFSNRLLLWARDASYPIYILHQTVIIVIAYFVIQQPWAPWTKYWVVLGATLLVCVLLYEFLLRRFALLRVAFGIKMHIPKGEQAGSYATVQH